MFEDEVSLDSIVEMLKSAELDQDQLEELSEAVTKWLDKQKEGPKEDTLKGARVVEEEE